MEMKFIRTFIQLQIKKNRCLHRYIIVLDIWLLGLLTNKNQFQNAVRRIRIAYPKQFYIIENCFDVITYMHWIKKYKCTYAHTVNICLMMMLYCVVFYSICERMFVYCFSWNPKCSIYFFLDSNFYDFLLFYPYLKNIKCTIWYK